MSPSSARVLFVSSESRPFASTGGLADVAGALPDTLNRTGTPVDRIMPLYRTVWEGRGRHGYSLQQTPHILSIPMGTEERTAEIYETELNGTRTYFVNHEEFFDRTELYALSHREYRDNFSRFLFFQKAVVALIDALGAPYDVVHLNDWQTGLLPTLLQKGIHGVGRVNREKTLFTIHNLAYQGMAPARFLYETNLPGLHLEAYPSLEYYGQINGLKAGLVESDRVNTVSPTYAREILQPEFGCGLEGVLASLEYPVRGIVNGVDTKMWDPETDTELPSAYTSNRLSGKETCKRSVLKEFGLTYDKEQPLFVMISRLVEQKGFDLISKSIELLMAQPVQVLLLGSGQDEYEAMARSFAERWPDRFGVRIGFDVGLSHRLEAGGDFFLMPSRFEPCGLNQLYSLRYGTIPLVNRTGGLVDTVEPIHADGSQGTGFLMTRFTSEALLSRVQDAVSLYHDKKALRKVRQRGMKQDISWDRTATEYQSLYDELIQSS